jgi:hypothetical protein
VDDAMVAIKRDNPRLKGVLPMDVLGIYVLLPNAQG